MDSAALRYAKYISHLPSAPGHHLATLSFTRNNISVVNWLIEGPWNNQITALVMITDFNHPEPVVTYDGYRIRGTFLERIRQTDFCPHTRSLRFKASLGNAVFPHLSGVAVFSGLRGADGVYPDAAMLHIDAGRTPFDIALSDIKKGFNPIALAAKVIVLVGTSGCTSNEVHIYAEEGATVTVNTDQSPPEASGTVDAELEEPISGVKLGLKGGFSTGPQTSGDIAPVTSGSGIAPIQSGTATVPGPP